MKVERGEDQPRSQMVSTCYGFSMYIDKVDKTVSQSIYTRGTWEPQNINLILKLVKPGDKVINMGSQSGL